MSKYLKTQIVKMGFPQMNLRFHTFSISYCNMKIQFGLLKLSKSRKRLSFRSLDFESLCMSVYGYC